MGLVAWPLIFSYNEIKFNCTTKTGKADRGETKQLSQNRAFYYLHAVREWPNGKNLSMLYLSVYPLSNHLFHQNTWPQTYDTAPLHQNSRLSSMYLNGEY